MAEEKTNDTLSKDDHKIVDEVDKTLADALDLKKWWDKKWRDGAAGADAFDDSFKLASTFNRPDASFGFFDEAPVSGSTMKIMGCLQEQFFDRAKAVGKSAAEKKSHAEVMRQQIRDFVLRYFMRISDFRQPEAFPDEDKEAPPDLLKPLSWCPTESDERMGFGFEQVYYKLREGEIGKFADQDKYAIVELTELGTKYEWIVVKVNIFDFKFTLAPLGSGAPSATVPLSEASYLVLNSDFILNQDDPEGDDLGRYGFGYGFLPDPEESLLAYGPGRFDAAFQTIDFHVRTGGEIFARMVFVANRPDKIVNVSIDPFEWGMRMTDFMTFGVASDLIKPMQKAWQSLPRLPGIDLVSAYAAFANLATAGAAEKELCISKKQLEKTFLVQHFRQHYNVIAGALVTWRQIPDWAVGDDKLPEWVRSGISS